MRVLHSCTQLVIPFVHVLSWFLFIPLCWSYLLQKTQDQMEVVLSVAKHSVSFIPVDAHGLSHVPPQEKISQHSEERWISWQLFNNNHTMPLLSLPVTNGSDMDPLFWFVCVPKGHLKAACEKTMSHPAWSSDYASTLDFIIPSSQCVDSEEIHRSCPEIEADATFLYVDFDARPLPGATISRRDYVIPYHALHAGHISRPGISAKRSILVFFLASPYGTLRSRFLKRYLEEDNQTADIIISIDPINEKSYLAMLSNSTFCLQLPGHTSSSSRLYMAIEAGCIPVFISDYYFNILPFNTLLNYSRFSIVFPNAEIYPKDVISTLRSLSDSQILELRSNLYAAQEHFATFKDVPYNPTELLFASIFLERVERCWGVWSSRQDGVTTKNEYESVGIFMSICKRIKKRILLTMGLDLLAGASELLATASGSRLNFTRPVFKPYDA